MLAWHPNPVPVPVFAVPHHDSLFADGAELTAALLGWYEHAGWSAKDAKVCYGGLVAVEELEGS